MADALAYHIRSANAQDCSAIAGLSQLWAEEACTAGNITLEEHDPSLQLWLDSGYFFVCELDHTVIAYAAGVVKLGKNAVFRPEGERFLHIHHVFVHPHHRGKNVGSQLMDALLSKAQSEDVHRSMVGSNNIDWQSTYRFYERHGYRMFSIEMYK